MAEGLSKDQLQEAFSLARAMGNAFKAFKNVEDVIARALQAQAEEQRLSAGIANLKSQTAEALSEFQAAVADRDRARADFAAEKDSIARQRKDALEAIESECAAQKAICDEEVRQIKEEGDRLSADLATAKAAYDTSIAAFDAGIEEKRGELAHVQEEIDALKQRLG